jgi:hypothetical protein
MKPHLEWYFEQTRQFPILDADEEQGLARRWRDSKGAAAARQLLGSHLRLVIKIARRFGGSIRSAGAVSPPAPCGGSGRRPRSTLSTTNGDRSRLLVATEHIFAGCAPMPPTTEFLFKELM